VSAFNLATSESLESAEKLLEQAILLEPGYGQAWSRLGWVAYSQSITGTKSAIDAYEESRKYAERALQLSPQLADAHALLQVVLVQADQDWAAAESEGRKALELDPTNSEVPSVRGGSRAFWAATMRASPCTARRSTAIR
jgi:tetratricopeptide (TPR) repeat protein